MSAFHRALIIAGRGDMPTNFDAAAGMAVWDEELWREFEATLKGPCGTPNAIERSPGRTARIGVRPFLRAALALVALLWPSTPGTAE
jgi:hypothetical protein